jgi:hypothetical protein
LAVRVIVLLAFLIALSAQSAASQRFALLIGNAEYAKEVGPLTNPPNDLKLIGNALRSLNFEVELVGDADFATLQKSIRNHAAKVAKAADGAISFVYYTGHGAADASTGLNYLIPIDVSDAATESLWQNSVELKADVIDRLIQHAPHAIHFIVFDACRNELLLKAKDQKVLTVAGKTFVPLDRIPGTLVAYSTAPGQMASDAGEGSGPYARALGEELLRPGVEAVTMFRNVQLRVRQSIGQDPWLTFPSLPAVFFAGEGSATLPAQPAPDDQIVAFAKERDSVRVAMQGVLGQLEEAKIPPSALVAITNRWTKKSIRICFFGGSRKLRSHVALIARQWTLNGNIDFDFGDWSDPALCKKSRWADVRVSFDAATSASWSFIGNLAAVISKDRPSMSLGPLSAIDESLLEASDDVRREILHVFGHVLGFHHNWSSASADCEGEMDFDFVHKWFEGPPRNWRPDTVDNTFRPNVSQENKVKIDSKSVLNFKMEEEFYYKGRDSRCWVEPRGELSLRDKLSVFVNYP